MTTLTWTGHHSHKNPSTLVTEKAPAYKASLSSLHEAGYYTVQHVADCFQQ